MPELPDVETFRRRASKAVGRTVNAVEAREGWAVRRLNGGAEHRPSVRAAAGR
ncbi:MAG: hypothetical protein HY553_09835 [Elusimicrobia bacterium]|nr:hypothetical protein [Elusimicrobiota bacterium]